MTKGLKLGFAALGTVLSLAFTTVAGAQQIGQAAAAQAGKMDHAAIERSWAIQAAVARIDLDKDAFINELIGSWVQHADGLLWLRR